MPEISKTHLGGTMRLGLRPTIFQPDTEWSQVRQLYGGAEIIWERHRHRYEVNPAYVDQIEAAGLRFTGKDEKGERMQVAELKGPSLLLSNRAYPSCRPPVLRRSPGAPRVLHATPQPVAGIPGLHRRRRRLPLGADPQPKELRAAASDVAPACGGPCCRLERTCNPTVHITWS